MKYVFLGGAGEVGGSCLLIQVADRNILIDCGVRVNQSGMGSLPDLAQLEERAPRLDAIFISHAHADHVGALPFVHKRYPTTPVYMTAATSVLSDIMLQDTARIQNQKADKPLYTHEMVKQTFQAIIRPIAVKDLNTWIPLWEGWDFQFILSGHILGAVSILLRTPEGTFLYTGDVSSYHQRTVNGIGDLSGTHPDFMWCEATYGESNHPSRSAEEQKIAKAVAGILENGGTVLIPSFALGRAQELILILKTAMQSGTIPTFNIFTDGLVNTICGAYKSLVRFGSNSLKNLSHNQREIFFTKFIRSVPLGERRKLLKDPHPKCIIASSGMLTGGASVEYAKTLATHPKNAIFLSGYQDAESPGRRLQELKQGDELRFVDGTQVKVKCQVQKFHLSAHSDQGQLISMIKRVNPKAIALAHGERNVIQVLREKLYKNYPVECPANGKLYDGTANPHWLPAHARAKMDAKRPVPMDVQAKIENNTIVIIIPCPEDMQPSALDDGLLRDVDTPEIQVAATSKRDKIIIELDKRSIG